MKKSAFWNNFQSLYVLLTSLIGFALVFCLYVWFNPYSELIDEQSVAAAQYRIWVFLLGIEAAFYTVVIVPCWKQFIDLLKVQLKGKDSGQRSSTFLILILTIILFLLLMGAINSNSNSLSVITDINLDQEHRWRILVLTIYGVITSLPIILSMILTYQIVYARADDTEGMKDEMKLFEVAHELLAYRKTLQKSLLILGVIVSLAPVATAALRSMLITLQQENATRFPLILIAAYGLAYTTVLIIFYAPVHLFVTETSRKLRDRLCPIDDLESLEDNLKKRKVLDEWLETNIGLTQNLKTGIVALSPLIASLLASLFGSDVNLP